MLVLKLNKLSNLAFRSLQSEREPLYDEDLDLKTEIKEELVEDIPNFVDMHQLETSSELMDSLEDVSITDVLSETKPSSSRATTNTSLENVLSSAPKFDNGDEFHLFGMFVASQLRAMPLRDALQTQLEIQTIIAQKRSQKLTWGSLLCEDVHFTPTKAHPHLRLLGQFVCYWLEKGAPYLYKWVRHPPPAPPLLRWRTTY